MVEVASLEPGFEEGHLGIGHCFDYELLVVREEEKAAACTGCLAGLEHIVAIVFRFERFEDGFGSQATLGAELAELAIQPGVDRDLTVDGHCGLVWQELGDVALERVVFVLHELFLSKILPALAVGDHNFVNGSVQCGLVVDKPVSVRFNVAAVAY